MTFAESAALANDVAFQDRVLLAAVRAAVSVASEEVGELPYYDTYLARAGLSREVLTKPEEFRAPFAWAVAANPAITSASLDSDIEFTVNSLWDGFAGVAAPEPPPTEE